jgi:hypothetical protein
MDQLNRYDVEISILNGMMRGYPDGNFKPKGYITRAEATFIVDRLTDKSKRDSYKPDLAHSKYTSYKTIRGPRFVVFNTDEYVGVWNTVVSSSVKSKGYTFQNGMSFQFYKEEATRDSYIKKIESDLFDFSTPDPWELSMGLQLGEIDFYIAKDFSSPNSAKHQEVYNDYINSLFGSKSSDFTAKFNQFAADMKKSPQESRDYMIANHRVRIMQEGEPGRIVAFISEKK